MKTLSLKQTLLSLACTFCVGSALAAPIPTLGVSVDGSLAEWGVSLANNTLSNLLPHTSAPGDASQACINQNAFYRCEDTNDSSNSYSVTPLSGGQNYDVEFFGMALQGGKLYFGVATGQRPDNGATLYSPGDLFLKINGVQYVIEMGGGVAGAVGGGAQTQGAAGSLYNIDGNGYTTGTVTLADQVAGSVWRASQGVMKNGVGPLGVNKPVQFDANNGQTQIGQASLYATLNSIAAAANQHAVWELGVDLSVFGLASGQTFTVDEARWGPSCYNDVLAITGASAQVPEPGTLALLALSLLGMGAARRRKAA